MTLDFHVIGSFITRKVGNGSRVRVGIDAIMGCDRSILHHEELIYNFQIIGKVSLNSMSNPTISTISSQGWFNFFYLNLTSEWASDCNNYIATLQRVHIRFGPLEDELIWGINMVGGSDSTKLGCEALFGVEINDEAWWWWKIWKVKDHPKTILIM